MALRIGLRLQHWPLTNTATKETTTLAFRAALSSFHSKGSNLQYNCLGQISTLISEQSSDKTTQLGHNSQYHFILNYEILQNLMTQEHCRLDSALSESRCKMVELLPYLPQPQGQESRCLYMDLTSSSTTGDGNGKLSADHMSSHVAAVWA